MIYAEKIYATILILFRIKHFEKYLLEHWDVAILIDW